MLASSAKNSTPTPHHPTHTHTHRVRCPKLYETFVTPSSRHGFRRPEILLLQAQCSRSAHTDRQTGHSRRAKTSLPPLSSPYPVLPSRKLGKVKGYRSRFTVGARVPTTTSIDGKTSEIRCSRFDTALVIGRFRRYSLFQCLTMAKFSFSGSPRAHLDVVGMLRFMFLT